MESEGHKQGVVVPGIWTTTHCHVVGLCWNSSVGPMVQGCTNGNGQPKERTHE